MVDSKSKSSHSNAETTYTVLLIENSDYDPNLSSDEDFKNEPLPSAKFDRIEMKKLLDYSNIDTLNNPPITAVN